MSAETFMLLPDAPMLPRRVSGCTSHDGIARMEREAERLEEDADDLRCEAAELEAKAKRIHAAVEKLRKDGDLSEPMAEFIRRARRCPRLDYFEREMLRQAVEFREWNNGELIHLGLLHALPVPHELFPPLCGRRAA